ncbi:protein yippee-like 1 isoform X1 [Zonotrichia albicollis]|uniref:protein yippee-like 1 isoform X1 n=1 Tax=Zonotrichia albicollis TaxID=44394 RepID=UPI003D80CE76
MERIWITLYRYLYKCCHFLLSHSLPSISDQRGKKSCEVTDKTRCVNIFKNEFCTKSFQGSQGRAYLFNSVVNVGCGPAEERVLLTGLHAVADIYCENCKTTLGWKYEHAFESSQKYKEGKFIIELAHMIKDNGWE